MSWLDFPKWSERNPDVFLDRTFGVNTMAHFYTLKAFLPEMIKQNAGHIVSLRSCAIFHSCGLVPSLFRSLLRLLWDLEVLHRWQTTVHRKRRCSR